MDSDEIALFAIGGGILAGIVTTGLLAWLVYAVLQMRSRRESQRLELQSRILDRVGSAKEFGEFLATEQGQRFLQALTPASSRPEARMLSFVRLGIMLVILGITLLILGWITGARIPGPDGQIEFLATLSLATGLGMLMSVWVSYKLGRKLGVLTDAPDNASRREPTLTP